MGRGRSQAYGIFRTPSEASGTRVAGFLLTVLERLISKLQGRGGLPHTLEDDSLVAFEPVGSMFQCEPILLHSLHHNVFIVLGRKSVKFCVDVPSEYRCSVACGPKLSRA